jgi:type II secretory pathway predicted ATPase ExeA
MSFFDVAPEVLRRRVRELSYRDSGWGLHVYLNFYGLNEIPFNSTPDPRFLYLTPGHREALAQLFYGIQERKGFIVLTGQVGTGKTTLLQALRRRLDRDTAVSYVFNSTLPFDGILECVLEDLGVTKPEESQARRFVVLQNLLIERERVGRNTVLIIDEAQNLDAATLEQIRLLSNVETATRKLLQILLAGQDELKVKLDLAELRQLNQQVVLRCQITPLTQQEVSQYIRNRLCVAGVHHLNLFNEGAIDRITEYAGGIPRVINTLGDHCLLFGYAEQKRRIDRSIVDQAIEYLEEGLTSQRSVWSFGALRSWRQFKWALVTWVLGTLVVVLASTVVAFVLSSDADVIDFVRSLQQWFHEHFLQRPSKSAASNGAAALGRRLLKRPVATETKGRFGSLAEEAIGGLVPREPTDAARPLESKEWNASEADVRALATPEIGA